MLSGLWSQWQHLLKQKSYFIHLGHSPNCQQNLLGDTEYQLALDVSLRR
jgi:hypothetical protein